MATLSSIRTSQIAQRPLSATTPRRLIAAGAVLIVLTTAANLLVATALRAWLNVPALFEPLGVPAVITMTVAGMAGAVIVFALLARSRRDPMRTFLTVAAIALVLSWIPDGLIWATGVFAATTARGVMSLMSLHLLSAVIAVSVLGTYGLKRD